MKSKELLIVRHAKSDWSLDPDNDFDRPLSATGASDAPRIGQWLASASLKPDLLITSPAKRAIDTAHAIADAIHIPGTDIIREPRLYLAGQETLLTVIAEISDRFVSVMLVGHNPGLENLLIHLCNDPLPVADNGTLLSTGNVFQLRFQAHWENLAGQSGQLVNFLRPNSLT